MDRPARAAEAKVPLSYTIAQMPETERPRERLATHGPGALRTTELIAILLRTGTKGVSAVQMAEQLLQLAGNSLDELAKTPLDLLAKQKGVGKAKAIQLKAAFELARRLRQEERGHSPVIDVPAKAADELREEFRGLDRESFRILLLSTKHQLLRVVEVSLGSLNASIVEPREVFKPAILASAANVILAHNHPSGDPTPSSEDIAITKRLVKAGEMLGIGVLDHIVMGQRVRGREQDFVSLKELGLM